ncbi:MAG TPA: metal-binding protein [Tissierellia bacterium]|nr:metal-binding protein [Tissierellia bacterium]
MSQSTDKKAYYFSHTECEYFPCHETQNPEEFNCLFCFCPLYILGDQCGGNFTYTEKGIKNCVNCLLPHRKKGYFYVISKLQETLFRSPLAPSSEKRGDIDK